LILTEGFDLAEPFCYRQADEPVSGLGWLGQVLFALAHRAAGWEGVQTLHVVAYVAAFAFVWARIRRMRLGPAAALLAVLLMFVACMTNCSERPQTFAFVAFSALLWIAHGRLPGRMYWPIVVPLLLAWQNIHPSVPVAAAVLGTVALGRYADERCGRNSVRGLWRRPLLTAIVAAGVVFCTPAGVEILEIGARNARISRWLGIGEWLPAHAMLPATSGFWMVLVVSAMLWVRCRLRLAWEDLLPMILLTVAALCWSRMIVFWAFLAAPILARLLHHGGLSMWPGPPEAPLSATAGRWLRVAVAVTLVLLATASPWLRPHMPWIPPSRRALLDPHLPLAGVHQLRQALGAGRIYNYREWGGLLAFFGAPHWQMAIDGRIYRYEQPVWESYAAVASGDDVYADVFARQRPAALFLRPDHDRGLIERILDDPNWLDYYRDTTCHIFISLDNALVRAGPVPDRSHPPAAPGSESGEMSPLGPRSFRQ
ncbi:MAG: hypothetical protein ACYS7M_12490, partial [Planctomycetota bacterium]|jgi:hypothetical protein